MFWGIYIANHRLRIQNLNRFAGNRYLKCLKSPTNANKQKINLATTTTMMIWSMNIHINIKPSRIINVNFIGKKFNEFFQCEMCMKWPQWLLQYRCQCTTLKWISRMCWINLKSSIVVLRSWWIFIYTHAHRIIWWMKDFFCWLQQ